MKYIQFYVKLKYKPAFIKKISFMNSELFCLECTNQTNFQNIAVGWEVIYKSHSDDEKLEPNLPNGFLVLYI